MAQSARDSSHTHVFIVATRSRAIARWVGTPHSFLSNIDVPVIIPLTFVSQVKPGVSLSLVLSRTGGDDDGSSFLASIADAR